MKKTFLLLLFITAAKSIAQIYFSSNTAMYVKNQVLFVKQNINLASNSNIYLRNNSQLLQGTAGGSANSGLGTLSVFQEGTSDNFDYNYWCSPVGNASGALGNESFGITMLGRPISPILSTPAIVLPVGNSDGTSNPLSIASKWIYKLVNANNYSQWIFVGAASTIGPGEGFTMKGTSGTDALDPAQIGVANNPASAQRYDFRGKPNDGNIVVTLGNGNATLTGNPYPSALHLNAFLLDGTNAAITGGIAYFWEQDKNVNSHLLSAYKGGYGAYAPGSLTSNGIYTPPVFNAYNQDGSLNTGAPASGIGTAILRRYAPIGQGFLLNGRANGTAVFKNTHRVWMQETPGGSQFEKSGTKDLPDKGKKAEDAEISHFKLNAIINNQFTRQLALAFLPEATDGIDIGIDAANLTADLPQDVGFWIQEGNYLIQGVNFDLTKKIPLLVKAAVSSTFKFYMPQAEVVNFDPDQAVYLYDALDGTYHNIRNEPYFITVAAGTYTDRFKITFTPQTLGIPENENNSQFFIFQDNINRNLSASNPNGLPIESFTLYDLNGRIARSKGDLSAAGEYSFPTSGLSDGVYIAVFLTRDDQKFTQKIIISNSRD
jgi:hypothetical protein